MKGITRGSFLESTVTYYKSQFVIDGVLLLESVSRVSPKAALKNCENKVKRALKKGNLFVEEAPVEGNLFKTEDEPEDLF